MLKQIIGILGRPVTSKSKDASIGSIVFYIAGILLFAMGTYKIASLNLTESMLSLAILVTVCASMQMLIMGALMELLSEFLATEKKHQGKGLATDREIPGTV